MNANGYQPFPRHRIAVCLISLLMIMPALNACAEAMKAPVKFSSGHETDPRDHGRPVVLIAAALNVKPEVFRKAFSGVTPARGRGPTPTEARRNRARS